MTILTFFDTYGTMILSVTLVLLLFTYWVLIYRIWKLEKRMQMFDTYGTMILSITLVLLLFTYWILIYRIWKLEMRMKMFDTRFANLEKTFVAVRDTVKDIAGKIAAFDLIKQGSIKLSAKSSVFGDVNVDLDLSKILGEKKDE